MKKYCIRDQKGSLHYIKAKNLEDAMSKIQHLQDAYVEEWWSLNIDENPYAFARKYGLTIEILKTNRDEVLYRFSGSKQQISKAMKNGYFYESEKYGDSSCKDKDEVEYLSDEEKQAIEDYKEAIKGTTNLKLLKLYAHILQEEIEHLEELENKNIEGE